MRLEYLRYQTQELEALNLQPDELIQLEEEHLRLANADRLLDLCQRAMGRLYDDDEASAQVFLSRALHDIQDLGALDMRLAPIGELLNTALIQVQEAGDELRRYMQTVELDPNRLGWIEQRLSDIHTVARKHRLSPPELPALSERLRQELEQLDNSTQKQAKLEQDLEAAWQRYSGCAAVLSGRRAEAATQLSARVSEAMAGLGMPGGRFELLLEEQRNPSAGGLEAVELLVSANPGQPLRPLSKVASGGELSRISLAIQVITAHSARIPTLVFDEVDTGIGGGIAEVVGQQLRALGADRQVLCVTHLPQVAAHAHHHLQIRKQTSKKSTRTEVWLLDEEQRVTEIARMLGGLKLTENTMAHAREMIEHAR
jgi:DNA repair protein RecN (Recombination protein N)